MKRRAARGASHILKISADDATRELEFELDYLRSLTTQERFTLMFRKSRELAEALVEHGHRDARRPKDLEDLRVLLRLKRDAARTS